MNDNQGIVSGSWGSSEGQAGRERQAHIGLCHTPLTSQDISDGREGWCGRGVGSEYLAEPLNFSSSSAESQRCSPCARQLPWASSAGSRRRGRDGPGTGPEKQQGSREESGLSLAERFWKSHSTLCSWFLCFMDSLKDCGKDEMVE